MSPTLSNHFQSVRTLDLQIPPENQKKKILCTKSDYYYISTLFPKSNKDFNHWNKKIYLAIYIIKITPFKEIVMIKIKICIVLSIFLISVQVVFGLTGTVKNATNQPIVNALVGLSPSGELALTDSAGKLAVLLTTALKKKILQL